MIENYNHKPGIKNERKPLRLAGLVSLMMFACSLPAVSVESNLLPFYNYTNGSAQVLKSTDEVFTQQRSKPFVSGRDIFFQ